MVRIMSSIKSRFCGVEFNPSNAAMILANFPLQFDIQALWAKFHFGLAVFNLHQNDTLTRTK